MSDCILWVGATNSGGYGKRSVGGRTISAHRHAYEQAHGPIPDGLFVLHRCHTRLCVNPEHLYAGTAQRNAQDCVEAGHHYSHNRTKTHCPQGHEYDGTNSQGRRICRRCKSAAQRRWREKVS